MADTAARTWSGARLELEPNQQAEMAQTPNGSMVIAWQNVGAGNSLGQLTLTSGGHAPEPLDAPAGAIAPTVMVHDWQGDNLKLTNTSVDAKTTITIEAYGPGIGRIGPFPIDKPVSLARGTARQGKATGGPMCLHLQVAPGPLALFVVVGGPLDQTGNNATIIALNDPKSPAPPGYTIVTDRPDYRLGIDWTTNVYVAFFGPAQVLGRLEAAKGATVCLTEL